MIRKKRIFTVLLCAFLMTQKVLGAGIDAQVIQVVKKALQKMAPEEIAQVEREGISGWKRVTINALTQALKDNVVATDVFDSVLNQLKSPEELSKFMRAHPDIVSDLKPGLQVSIERLVLEGQGEVQASVAPVTSNLFGRNRLQALLEPTDGEMTVLMGAQKAERNGIAAAASASQEAVPQFLDRTFLQGAAFSESIAPEVEKEVLFHAIFPEFRVSKELLRTNYQEWIALLIDHGEFTLTSSKVTEKGTLYVLKSAQAGGVEMTVFTTSFNGDVRLTSIDLCYSFQEKGVESLVSYRHHISYLDDNISAWVIERDGKSILDRFYGLHY